MESILQSQTSTELGKRRRPDRGRGPAGLAAAMTADEFAAPTTPDLRARVVYFPVRHHSPACAHHVASLIRTLRPSAVLIEGPRDATPLIPLLLRPETRCPVAIYTTYVDRANKEAPRRHAAYYPLCDYSPELVALRAADEVGASAKFIDLTFPEMVRAGRIGEDDRAQSLFDEHALTHSHFLKAVCQRTGARDPDELWDHLYEVEYETVSVEVFMRAVSTYCALARHDQTPEALAADGTLAREQAMAAAVAQEDGDRILVVTGGFHTVALPTTVPAMPPRVEAAEKDALVVLMRYGFEQLDRLNGYASGMPAPDFYQRRWDGGEVGQILVELGRRCRQRRIELSVADEIAALDHCRLLASLRGHSQPSREDVLDAIRACFIKGTVDIEGVLVLALARQLLAGNSVGSVPPDAGQPPIVEDFRVTARRLTLDLDRIEARETALDLYRKTRHRELSRFFYRLAFLDVPFADLVRGPDFVRGVGLERVQEVWKYHWSPAAESALIERSVYGASVEEAAASLLLERFAQAELKGQGRRADVATHLLLEACQMGLHRHTQDLFEQTRDLVAEDSDFVSLITAVETLLMLHLSREPLEAHGLIGVTLLAGQAYNRAIYVLPQLAATPDDQTETVLDALNAMAQSATTLDESEGQREARHTGLQEIAETAGGNAALRGAAAGTLHADGAMSVLELVRHLRGHLLGAAASDGPAFLRGLMRTARSVLWRAPAAIDAVHEVLRSWTEDQFVSQVPNMRLAFADLTPRECDELAACVARRFGIQPPRAAVSGAFSESDLLLAIDIEARLKRALQRDGLDTLADSESGA